MPTIKRWFSDRYVDLVCRVTPKCHEMTRLISLAQEEELPLFQRLRMRLHYRICIWCERYLRHLDLLRAASRAFPEKTGESSPETMSAEAKKRLRDALRDSE